MATAHISLDVGPVSAVALARAFADGRTIGGRRGCHPSNTGRGWGHPGADRQGDDDLMDTEALEVLGAKVGSDFLRQPTGVRSRGLEDDPRAGIRQNRLPDLRRELAKVLMRQCEAEPECPGLCQEVGNRGWERDVVLKLVDEQEDWSTAFLRLTGSALDGLPEAGDQETPQEGSCVFAQESLAKWNQQDPPLGEGFIEVE